MSRATTCHIVAALLWVCVASACDATLSGSRTGGPATDAQTTNDITAVDEVCGDGVRGGAEQCDGQDLAGRICTTEGFAGGTLACTPDCTLDTTGCERCGDGVINGSEACDGAALAGRTCQSEGFDSGTLACDALCHLDLSSCSIATCGNGSRDAPEPCEGTDLGGKTCQSEGFDGGELTCDDNCALNTSSCYTCGDGVINGAEQCDGSQLGGETCQTQGFEGGALGCTATCAFHIVACFRCGDGVINGTEQCDGVKLGGKTCQSLGYAGGTLACRSDCTLDTTACTSAPPPDLGPEPDTDNPPDLGPPPDQGPPLVAFYVRAGATGAKDGADWTNAYTALPQQLVRGATYYVASGSYAGYTFDDASSGTEMITIRKATAQDHGTNTGWQASYAQGQAVFGPLSFNTERYVLDGATPLGIKAVGGFQGLVVAAKGDHLTLRNTELDGNFAVSGGQHTDGACNVIDITGSNVTLDGCDIHNAADDGVGVYGDDIQVLHSKIHQLHGCGTDGGCGPCYNGHSDGLELQSTTNVTLIGNLVYDIKSTAGLITGQWSPGNYTVNLVMKNNIFYTPDTGVAVYLYYVKGAKVLNNVIWGRTQGTRYGGLAIGPEMTDLELKNNIILNINYSHLGATFDATQHKIDYNVFGMIDASEYTAAAHDIIGDPQFSVIPLSSDMADHKTSTLVASDFHLKAGSPAIDNGLGLPGEVDVDLDGIARPKDGDGSGGAQWDIGAFERVP